MNWDVRRIMADLAAPQVAAPQPDQPQPAVPAAAVALPPQPTPHARNATSSVAVWRSALVAWAAIAFVPLAFVVATRGDWLLDFGGEDGWIYIKLFMVWGDPHADLRTFLDTNYKAARVPWIIPGWLLYQLAGPLTATYLLHLLVLVGTALAVWRAVRRLFGDGTAVITALLAIAYPGFQSSGITYFWNYHGQAAVAYYLLATLAVALARDARYPVLWFALAGAALVATVGTAITHVVLLPAFGVLTLALLPRLGVRPLLTALAGGVVGVAAGVVVFGLANWLVGGPFLFFWAQITATREYTDATPQQPFLEAFPTWVRGVRWAGFPPLVAAISLVALWPLARWQALGAQRWVVIGCLAQHLVAWVVLLLLEDRSQLIQVAFHYHLIVGSAIFALAALIWVGLRLDRRALSVMAVAVLTVGLILPQLLLDERARDAIGAALDLGRWLPLPSSDWWAYALALTAGLALLLLGLTRRLLPLTALGSALLGVSCALNAVSADAFQPPDRCSYVANQYRLILKTVEWSVARQLDTKALVWFDPAATLERTNDCPAIPMFPIFDAIQHGTIIRLAAQPVPPRLADASTAQLNGAIRSRERMVVLSTPAGAADAEEQFQTWLRRASVRGVAERGERFEVADGDVAVVLQVFELRRR